MDKKELALQAIVKQGALPLFFHPSEEVSIQVLRALYAGGVRAIEYTNRGKEALSNFKAMLAVRDAEMKDMFIGIGTIKNAAGAMDYIQAGADYIISPGLVQSVVVETDKVGLLYIPGCQTVSEIIQAESSGIKFVKLFPGNVLGPGFMSAIKEVFPGLYFMPTGGVDMTEESIGAWFKAGVVAVGLGSKLLTKELLESKNYADIQSATKKALSIAQSFKK
jgi:2-dehydro-3-deoxyphosphogluconate aldolase / (4S)-4-hydroxy-2-oxoglutarate aldolase